jgi:hypothetical protein
MRLHRGPVLSHHLPGLRLIALFASLLFLVPPGLDAQYFGRNKVQYDEFDTRVLATPHFDIHFYPGMEEAIHDVSRMAERWYERLARLFQHEFYERKPLIFYADHPDFQQTNTIPVQVGEGTGGVTESLKNRVIMPLSGSYASTDHVLGHELVHAFQYDLAQSRRGGGMPGLSRLSLWMIEGMAEYLSLGREDPLTAMWLRDALLRDDFPTLTQLTRESRFFPYRFGQAFWTFVGGRYGDEAVVSLFRTALRLGPETAIQQVLGIDSDSLSVEWRTAVETAYRPLMEGKTPPGESGTLLLAPSTGAGEQNVAPSISPDGQQMVVMSERDLFSFDLYLADARTGEITRTLASAASDSHMDALRFIDSSGAWSPDGLSIAIVTFARGRNDIVILDSQRGGVRKRLDLPEEIGEVSGPSWSPDGESIVFSGQVGGLTDLFIVDVDSEEVTRLTSDRFAHFQPVYSPDASTIAFVTDRGPETDFDALTYSRMRLGLYDLASGEVEVLELFGNVRHSNPQYSPDGLSLYFLSDPDGFSDIYRVELSSGEISRLTTLATAVTGITSMSPAMSVARETGTVVFSVFDEFQFHVYSMDSRDAPATPVVAEAMDPAGRILPSGASPAPSRVEAYLADPALALVPPGTYNTTNATAYRPSLTLDYLGQPMIGVGIDQQFGNFVQGSIAAYFSDMLGNRNLGVAVQAQGTFKDIGGQFVYQNLENRWNWGVAAGRIPYLQIRTGGAFDPSTGVTEIRQQRYRIFNTQAAGLASYPFSSTRRVDFSGGVTRYSFDLEQETLFYDRFGRLVGRERTDLSEDLPDPLNLVSSSAALVGDNSYFGFTSPVRGGRYRLEVGTTVGSLNYHSLTLDYRRYFNPVPEFTFAIRGMHLGRYGREVEQSILNPMFLGWESYVRGYSPYSFEFGRECTYQPDGSCPEWDRLEGHRIAVANVEMRVPIFGADRFGLLGGGFLPTELIAFTDAGLAWDSESDPVLEFSRNSLERVPVVSSGVGARVNLLGFLIFETHYVYPWQRPFRGGHWGFQFSPGW